MRNYQNFSVDKNTLSEATILTHLCLVDSYTLSFWTSPFPIKRMTGYVLLLPCFIEIHVFNANSVDRDQMPHSAASDLSLHCLPKSFSWGARHKWVKDHDQIALLVFSFLRLEILPVVFTGLGVVVVVVLLGVVVVVLFVVLLVVDDFVVRAIQKKRKNNYDKK